VKQEEFIYFLPMLKQVHGEKALVLIPTKSNCKNILCSISNQVTNGGMLGTF